MDGFAVSARARLIQSSPRGNEWIEVVLVLGFFETFKDRARQAFRSVMIKMVQVNQARGRAIIFLFYLENPLEQARLTDTKLAAQENEMKLVVL